MPAIGIAVGRHLVQAGDGQRCVEAGILPQHITRRVIIILGILSGCVGYVVRRGHDKTVGRVIGIGCTVPCIRLTGTVVALSAGGYITGRVVICLF